MKVAVLGSTGWIARQMIADLAGRGTICLPASRRTLDYTHPQRLASWLADVKPDFLINCAGFTGKSTIDECEHHKAECLFVNSVLPGRIAKVCADLDVPWAHLSTGCIYSGDNGGAGFTESDRPNFDFRHDNCSFYSGTKALGEEVLAEAPGCYVWRIRMPFTHVDSLRNLLSKLLLYDRLLDVRNSLTCLPDFFASIPRFLPADLPFGIYHLTNPGSIRTSEIVALIRRHLVVDHPFHFFTDESEFFAGAARRAPRSNCTLDVRKALAAGLPLRPVHEAVDWCLANWIPAPGASSSSSSITAAPPQDKRLRVQAQS